MATGWQDTFRKVWGWMYGAATQPPNVVGIEFRVVGQPIELHVTGAPAEFKVVGQPLEFKAEADN